MQGRSGDTNVENGLVDTVEERLSGLNGESSINIYTVSGVRWIADKKLLCSTGSPVWGSVMTWRDGIVGRVGKLRREEMFMTDLCCIAENMKEGMAIYSSVLAWRTPWTEETGRLQSIELDRDGRQLKQLSTLACIA